MVSRSAACLLAFTVAVWASLPAMATVECRPGAVCCAHCRSSPRAEQTPAVRSHCCIVHAAPDHLPAEMGATPASADPHVAEASGAPIAAVWAALGREISWLAAVPTPPPLQRNRPLLH